MARQRHDFRARDRRGGCAEGWQANSTRDVEDVRHDGRGGRARSGAAALVDRFSNKVALGNDSIEDAIDVGKRRAVRDHCRVHALGDAAAIAGGDTEQLDAEPELIGEGDVVGCDALDTLDMDTVESWRVSEGHGRQQR